MGVNYIKKFHTCLKVWKPIHLCWFFNKMGWPIPPYFIGGAPVVVQVAYMFAANDNAAPDSCTFDSQDTPRGDQAKEIKFMIRFLIQDTVAQVLSRIWSLYYDLDNTPATATKVTTVNTVITMMDGLPADAAALPSNLLTGGSGSYVAGVYCESDQTGAFTITKSNYSELQFCVQLGADSNPGQDYYFFVRLADAALDTYTSVAQITSAASSSSSRSSSSSSSRSLSSSSSRSSSSSSSRSSSSSSSRSSSSSSSKSSSSSSSRSSSSSSSSRSSSSSSSRSSSSSSSRSSSSSSSRSSSSSSSSRSSSSSSSRSSSSSSSRSSSSSSSRSSSSSSSSRSSSSSSSSAAAKIYSRGNYTALQSDETDLETAFSDVDYITVANDDENYVEQTA